jgi:hypothetical protein
MVHMQLETQLQLVAQVAHRGQVVMVEVELRVPRVGQTEELMLQQTCYFVSEERHMLVDC